MERKIAMIISNQSRQLSKISIVLLVAIAAWVVPVSFAQAQTDKDYSAVEKKLNKFVKKGDITKQQFEKMMNVLTEEKPLNSDPKLFKTLRDFAGNANRIELSFQRRKDSKIELDHFNRLGDLGVAILDVKLDAQRRYAQAKIAFDTVAWENAAILKLLEKHFSQAIKAKEITDDQYVEWRADVENTMSDLRKKLGTELDPAVIRDELWLSKRNIETAKQAKKAAFETWRIVNQQYESGSEVSVQQLAQASEQFHYFDAQLIEAIDTQNEINQSKR